MKKLITVFCCALAAMLTSSANAQFFDNFDSYANGQVLDNPGTENGWQGWDNVPAAAGTATNAQSQSAPNSIAIGVGTDAVNRMGSPASGAWEFTAEVYVPTGSTGAQYLILNNQYNDLGPYNWSVQTLFNADAGLVTDDFDTTWAGTPIVFDTWMPVRLIIDLDNDTFEQYINGVLTTGGSNYPWSTRAFDNTGNGTATIGALDLFNLSGTTIYWDNVSLQTYVAGPNCPTDFTLGPDCFQQSGNFSDSCDSDDVYWGIQSTTFAARFAPAPINIELDGVIPIDGNGTLTFCFEGHPTLGGGTAFLTVALFNYTTGLYEQTPFTNQPDGSPGNDTTYCKTVDNSNGDYVDGEGNVKARITCAKTGAGPVRLFIDSMYWE